jgi:hypothetical protein
MSGGCVGEPVSWLRLERYQLDEIAGAERARIEEHLAACAACRVCLARIGSDEREPLSSLSTPRPIPLRRRAEKPSGRRRLWLTGDVPWIAAAVFVVAVAIGSWRQWFAVDERTARVERGTVKGGEVALTLVRDDGETIAGERGVYRDGDRMKALVTCPPGARVVFDLVVLDTDGASFPLEPARAFPCGNRVPLPGAFRLTGGAEKRVCIGWSESKAVDRAALAHALPSDHVVCVLIVAGDR